MSREGLMSVCCHLLLLRRRSIDSSGVALWPPSASGSGASRMSHEHGTTGHTGTLELISLGRVGWAILEVAQRRNRAKDRAPRSAMGHKLSFGDQIQD